MIRLGFIDNPSQTSARLFDNPFTVSAITDPIKVIKDLNFNLIEIQLPLTEEVSLEGKNFERIKEYVNELRENNIYIMLHAPFLTEELRFKWLVKPSDFDDAVELSVEEIRRTIDLCAKLSIERLTVHATTVGVFLSAAKFEVLKSRLKRLLDYIKQKKYIIKLSIETGGLKKEQLLELAGIPGLFITFDLAHYCLDNIEPQQSTLDFFDRIAGRVSQVHLSQTEKGKDLHMPVYNEGFINNRAFISHLKRVEHDLFIVLECRPEKDSISFVRENLS